MSIFMSAIKDLEFALEMEKTRLLEEFSEHHEEMDSLRLFVPEEDNPANQVLDEHCVLFLVGSAIDGLRVEWHWKNHCTPEVPCKTVIGYHNAVYITCDGLADWACDNRIPTVMCRHNFNHDWWPKRTNV